MQLKFVVIPEFLNEMETEKNIKTLIVYVLTRKGA